MSAPGRNDPCPCGSGSKFKRCCGTSPLAFVDYTDSDQACALAKLNRFSTRPEFAEVRLVAEVSFWGPRAAELEPELREEMRGFEMVEINFQSYFVQEFVPDLDAPGEPTILDLYLRTRSQELTQAEQRFLDDLRVSYVAPYEVVEVERGEGMRLQNLWIPGTVWVTERTATKSVQLWDILAARVMLRPNGEHVLQGSLFPFPAAFKQRILERLESEHRAQALSCPALTPQAFLRRLSPCYHTLWLESGPLRDAPDLATFDGERIQPITAHFVVSDLPRLRTLLRREPDVWHADEGGWTYGRQIGGMQHAMAWLHFGPDGSLLVDAFSEKHMEEVRGRLLHTAGTVLSHVETRSLAIEEFLREREAEKTLSPEPQTKRAKQLQFRALDEYYRRWVDEQIPALDGRTPREAAKDERLRPRLVQLLKEMENQEARAPAAGTKPYDLDRLWRALGLQRPGAPSRATLYPHLVADIRHYLDDGSFSARIPREARTLALYLGRIVANAAHDKPDVAVQSELDCRRRPDRRPCVGQLLVRREAGTDRVLWLCPACGDGGSIHGWSGTPFDPGARERDPPVDGHLVRERVFVDQTELRTLERVGRLSRGALALVTQVQAEGERLALDGERSEFAELRDCIAEAQKCCVAPAEARRLAWIHQIVSLASRPVVRS